MSKTITPMSTTGHCSFMPVNLFGKTERVKSKNSDWKTRAKVWCCFLDPQAQAPHIGHLRADKVIDFSFLHDFYLSTVSAVEVKKRTLETEVRQRINEKRDRGFYPIPGNWYLSRPGVGVIDFDRLNPVDQRKVRILEVGINGIGEIQPVGATEDVAPARQTIQSRLSEANPIADSWFFHSLS